VKQPANLDGCGYNEGKKRGERKKRGFSVQNFRLADVRVAGENTEPPSTRTKKIVLYLTTMLNARPHPAKYIKSSFKPTFGMYFVKNDNVSSLRKVRKPVSQNDGPSFS